MLVDFLLPCPHSPLVSPLLKCRLPFSVAAGHMAGPSFPFNREYEAPDAASEQPILPPTSETESSMTIDESVVSTDSSRIPPTSPENRFSATPGLTTSSTRLAEEVAPATSPQPTVVSSISVPRRFQLAGYTCGYAAVGLICSSDSGDLCLVILGTFDVPSFVDGVQITRVKYDRYGVNHNGNCDPAHTFIAGNL